MIKLFWNKINKFFKKKFKKLKNETIISFHFHHIYGVYIVFKLEEDAQPGSYAKVFFSKEHIKKFDLSKTYKINNLIDVFHKNIDKKINHYYFPFGGKKGDCFIVKPQDFLAHRIRFQTILDKSLTLKKN